VGKILKRAYLQVEESWCGFIKWCKNLGVDSSSGYYTLQLGQVKDYNTQVWFGTWGMDEGLLNHLKNQVCKLFSLPIYFKYFNYIVGYCIYWN